jgi:hypothetical protein
VSVAVFEEKARALTGLAKGAEVYMKGRLTMNAGRARIANNEPSYRSRRGR